MWIVLFIGSCLGLATLAGFFGGSWWVLDLFAGFRHQLAAGLLLCCLLAGLARWNKTALALGVLAIINLSLVLPLFLGPDRPETGALRVLSFNVRANNRRFDEAIDFIRASGADVVVLHEVTLGWEDAVEAASHRFDDWSYEITKAGGLGGTLVLAPTGSVVESFGFGLSDARAVEIMLPAGIAILAVHPLSPYNVFRAEQNDHQLGFAADWAANQDGPAIVVGDFNATPWSFPFRRLLASTDLLDSARGFGLELSYPADSNPLLRISIDHLLHSPDFAVVDRRLGPAMGSDHFPLTVDLAMRAPS